MSSYADRPWLQHLTPEQLAPVDPPQSMLHAFRASADRVPDATALAYFDTAMSYREVDELSDGLANHLVGHGFARGDRLALILQNIPQFVSSHSSVRGRPAAPWFRSTPCTRTGRSPTCCTTPG